MISCPAAKGIRWVNPSRATVSPSRTVSRTASESESRRARASILPRPAAQPEQPTQGFQNRFSPKTICYNRAGGTDMSLVRGLHHITVCAAGAQEDIDFMTQVCGQRL